MSIRDWEDAGVAENTNKAVRIIGAGFFIREIDA